MSMTVRELLHRLTTLDPDAPVRASLDGVQTESVATPIRTVLAAVDNGSQIVLIISTRSK